MAGVHAASHAFQTACKKASRRARGQFLAIGLALAQIPATTMRYCYIAVAIIFEEEDHAKAQSRGLRLVSASPTRNLDDELWL